jgi:hypothetical protein
MTTIRDARTEIIGNEVSGSGVKLPITLVNFN